jgi:diacylglycerol kinase (ATP)
MVSRKEPGKKNYNGNGLGRIWNAQKISLLGLRTAFVSEAAFRQETALVLVLTAIALLLDVSGAERALLIGSAMLVLIVELLNSAIEFTLDRISKDFNTVTKNAKDIGSAAVFLSILNLVLVWLCILVPLLRNLLT